MALETHNIEKLLARVTRHHIQIDHRQPVVNNQLAILCVWATTLGDIHIIVLGVDVNVVFAVPVNRLKIVGYLWTINRHCYIELHGTQRVTFELNLNICNGRSHRVFGHCVVELDTVGIEDIHLVGGHACPADIALADEGHLVHQHKLSEVRVVLGGKVREVVVVIEKEFLGCGDACHSKVVCLRHIDNICHLVVAGYDGRLTACRRLI